MTWRPVTTPAPEWFTRAIEVPYRNRTVEVDGVPIHYLDWGQSAKPGLILIHGGAAHAHWWTFLGPFFADDWHVVAIDMSGHGDSGRRQDYSLDMWATEIMAVAEDAEFPGPPVIVGHSLGGMVAIHTAASHGDRLAGAVVVDAPVRRPDPESEEAQGSRTFRTPGIYPTLAEALPHFRVIPPQPCDNDFILDHIARYSLHQVPDGWTWKFDPELFNRRGTPPPGETLRNVKCRVALLRGDQSVIVPPDIAAYMYDLLDRHAPVISIPEAHHHLILDQPLAFVAAMRTLLGEWQHSTPHRTP